MEKVIDIRPIKKKMRAQAKEGRLSMDSYTKSSYDKKICNKLLNLWAVRETDTFLCYVSTEIEVNTKEFINAVLTSGKRVAVPRCEGGPSEMNFYYRVRIQRSQHGRRSWQLSPPPPHRTGALSPRGAFLS